MRIALTGAHSTGKTTLLNDIIQKIDNDYSVCTITEVARRIISMGYPLSMDANMDSYIVYLNEQLKEEQKKMFDCDILISDRTILDPIAYAIVNSRLPRPYIQSYFIELMKNVWLMEKNLYDLYLYFPIEFPMTEDSTRPVDEKYRNDVDKEIQNLLKEYNVPFYVVTGALTDRSTQVMSLINRFIIKNGTNYVDRYSL